MSSVATAVSSTTSRPARELGGLPRATVPPELVDLREASAVTAVAGGGSPSHVGSAPSSRARTTTTPTRASPVSGGFGGGDGDADIDASALIDDDLPAAVRDCVLLVLSLTSEEMMSFAATRHITDQQAVIAGSACILLDESPSWRRFSTLIADPLFKSRVATLHPRHVKVRGRLFLSHTHGCCCAPSLRLMYDS